MEAHGFQRPNRKDEDNDDGDDGPSILPDYTAKEGVIQMKGIPMKE